MNPWIKKVKDYHSKHPELTYKQCMQKLANKKKHGGNPLAIAEAVSGGLNAIGGVAESIGNQIEQGRRTTRELEREDLGLDIKQMENIGNAEKKFMQFYRDLMHKRFWDGDSLPPYLRFERYKTNNPKYAKEQKIADQKLYDYAEKVYGRR